MTNSQTHLVAVFDSIETARKAQHELMQEGFSQEDLQIAGDDKPRVQTASSGSSYPGETTAEGGIAGFFHRIFGSDNENEESDRYAEAVSRGSAVLTVEAEGSDVDVATKILNQHNPIDLNEGNRTSSGSTGKTSAQQTASLPGDRTLPVVQEEMQVGKRTLQQGGVRVYTRVTEQPVQETVSLHEERARVERRAVDRPATAADLIMKDEVIEVIETREEAVVGKTARVVEEVVVGKQATDHTETVRDTVRRTDVEVEDISPDVDNGFREDFQTRFRNQSGATYESYKPAYQYGYKMANDSKYKGHHWSDIENSLKNDYSTSNPGTAWESVSGAIREGWNKVSGSH